MVLLWLLALALTDLFDLHSRLKLCFTASLTPLFSALDDSFFSR